eukprot:TRINITY_DN12228_c0_g1_i1.p1 TRINITY_DN12228_c0_g1~~TRINITY_DN12228_c0_g1_i1.p1  ORF type:complete len:209 (-),score=16.37 TRINITY_DN12228_c0_g1_i1:451-1077(-)
MMDVPALRVVVHPNPGSATMLGANPSASHERAEWDRLYTADVCLPGAKSDAARSSHAETSGHPDPTRRRGKRRRQEDARGGRPAKLPKAFQFDAAFSSSSGPGCQVAPAPAAHGGSSTGDTVSEPSLHDTLDITHIFSGEGKEGKEVWGDITRYLEMDVAVLETWGLLTRHQKSLDSANSPAADASDRPQRGEWAIHTMFNSSSINET